MAVTSLEQQANQQASLLSRIVYLIAQYFIRVQCHQGGYPSRFPLKMLQYSADHGHTQAMSGLGRLLYKSGACRAEKRSGIEYVRRAAKCDEPDAQFLLGEAYLKDDIFHQKNKQLAIHWLALAADKGHTQASQTLQAIAEKDSSQRKSHSQPTTGNNTEKATEQLESA